MEKVTIYANGLVNCSVCADNELTPDDVEHLVNKKNLTGIDSKWKIAPKFADGSSSPHACEKDPSRLHYLLTC